MKKWDLPKEWEWKSINDLSKSIQYGYTDTALFKEGGPKFLRITDIQNGDVDWNDVPYCSIDQESEKKYRLEVGDILFARTGATVGKSYRVKNKIDSIFASYLIRLQINKNVDSRYVYYYLQSPYYWSQIKQGQVGAGQPSFNASKIREIDIPVPPPETQQKIVAILDKAEKIKRLRTEANAQTQKLIQSVFLDMFGDPLINSKGWDCDSIHALAKKGYITVQNGFACGDHNELGFGIPQLRPMNINELGEINMEKILFINPKNKKVDKYLIKINDIIFNNTNSKSLVGKSAVWNEFMEENKYVLSNHMTILRLNGESPLISHYFCQFLNYLWREEIFENMCTPHVNQASVSFDRLGKISVPLPDIGLQKQYQKIVNEIIRNRSIQRSYDKENIFLMNILIQNAFYGELVA